MPTKKVSFTAPYTPDRGGTPIQFTGVFSQPPAMSAAQAASIIAAVGGTAAITGKHPCDLTTAFKARRLRFLGENGLDVSVPIPDPGNVLSPGSLIGMGSAIRAVLQAIDPIVCIQLIGEEFTRLEQILKTSTVAPAVGPSTRPAAGVKQPMYGGGISYKSDSGLVTGHGFKMNTNVPNSPFTAYLAEINACLGTLLPKGCGSGKSLSEARHYTVEFLVDPATDPKGVRSLIVPEAQGTPASILACGTALANNVQTLCLNYKGESHRAFTRYVP